MARNLMRANLGRYLNTSHSFHFRIKRNFASKHPIDTFQLIKRLQNEGFTRSQAIGITEVLYTELNEKSDYLVSDMLSKSELEKDQYLYKAALSELRTEVQILRRNDQSILTTELDAISKDREILNQQLRERIDQLKADLQLELNTHHHEMRFLTKGLDLQLSEIISDFQLTLSDYKTQIEAMKWDIIRQGILMLFFSAGSLSLLTFLFKKKEVKQVENKFVETVPLLDKNGIPRSETKDWYSSW